MTPKMTASPRPRSLPAVAVMLASAVATAALAVPAAAQAPVAKGRFGPTAKYTGTGTATVRGSGSARTISTSRDFTAKGAIRLRFYLATGPSAKRRIDLGPMAKRGAQSFRIPKGVDLRRYRYAIAWCVTVDDPITQAILR